MPHAWTLIRTQPGSGSGISRSTSSKDPFACGTWTARIFFAIPTCRASGSRVNPWGRSIQSVVPDVNFSFQGAPDAKKADLEKSYRDEFAHPEQSRRWIPKFEEFECSGNLGLVRSTWRLEDMNYE